MSDFKNGNWPYYTPKQGKLTITHSPNQAHTSQAFCCFIHFLLSAIFILFLYLLGNKKVKNR